MKAKRQADQHAAQIRSLRRSIAINAPIIAVCFVVAVCSWVYSWHPLLVGLITFISFMQLMHLPGLFTRLSEQKRKLLAAEKEVQQAQQGIQADGPASGGPAA